MSLNVKDAGTWKEVLEVYVKDSGTWKACKDVYVNDSGTWKSVLYQAGSSSYSTPGTYSWTVPAGVYAISSTIVGGGGGGGGFYGSGDNHAGGGGGSGGKYVGQSIAVTPGETLTIVVGSGGGSASFEFNGGFGCVGTAYGTSGTYWNGKPGQSSMIKRGSTVLYEATGGGEGLGAGPGDNMGSSAPGAGGLPSGVAGTAGNPNRNSYSPAPGGSNGTGYGSGGQGNGNTGFPGNCPGIGGNGYVAFTW